MNDSCANWDIFTDIGQFDGAVVKTDKGFAAESCGLQPDYRCADRRDSGAAWMERGVEVDTGLFTATALRFEECG